MNRRVLLWMIASMVQQVASFAKVVCEPRCQPYALWFNHGRSYRRVVSWTYNTNSIHIGVCECKFPQSIQVTFTRTIDIESGKLLSRTLTHVDAQVIRWSGLKLTSEFVQSGWVNVYSSDKARFTILFSFSFYNTRRSPRQHFVRSPPGWSIFWPSKATQKRYWGELLCVLFGWTSAFSSRELCLGVDPTRLLVWTTVALHKQ